MSSVVSAAVPVCYVKNLESAQRFYAMFGYTERQTGSDQGALWSYLQSGDHALLLACVQPPLIQVELPLLIYLYVEDLAAVQETFEAAGHPTQRTKAPLATTVLSMPNVLARTDTRSGGTFAGLSRAFKELKAVGVSGRGHRIAIADPALLHAFSDFEDPA